VAALVSTQFSCVDRGPGSPLLLKRDTCTKAAWPLVARAQQPEKTRLVGILMGFADSSDPDGQIRLAAFRQALAALGWREEEDNLRTELRWGAGDV
jgi:putative tryptophan/tyrosine transport system substrate-binding protein